MNTSIKVLWIDDDSGHIEDARNLESVRKSLRVLLLHPCDLDKKLVQYKDSSGTGWDIFLVDYYLNLKVQDNQKRYPYLGLTVAAKIRETFVEHPIYLVTAQMDDGKPRLLGWAQAVETSFDAILTLTDVQRQGAKIYYDALDYRSVRQCTRENLEALLELVAAPHGVRGRLKLVLPDELKEGLAPAKSSNVAGNAIAFTKWVRELLLMTPGFLYDDLHASTYLGIDSETFGRLSARFGRAKYSGIFSRSTVPLWWVSELDNILFSYKKAQKIRTTNPWEVAPLVFDVSNEHKTKCAMCGGLSPETVGINLQDDDDLRPVHYRCSHPHPKKARKLYFDEPRAFKLPG